MARVNDLTGQVFGCKEVLYRVKTPRGTNAWWRVKCIYCGREKNEMGSKLKLPTYQNCYCRMKGTPYIIENDYAIFTDSKGKEFIVSSEDIDKIKDYTWYVRTTTNKKQYVECTYLGISLHRFLLSPSKDKVVDHINGNTLDNRRDNLRLCSHTQNMQNQKLRTNNTSGVKGVTMCGKKYRATIRVNKKDMHLGVFNTLEEAKEVRLKAEKEYFGEFQYKGDKS